MSVGEPPVADYEPEALPNIASEDVEPWSRHAFVASRSGWAVDDFDRTEFSFALLAPIAVIGSAAFGGPFVLRASLVASAFGGLAGGALADRLAQVRVLIRGTRPYLLFDAALPAGARKGDR